MLALLRDGMLLFGALKLAKLAKNPATITNSAVVQSNIRNIRLQRLRLEKIKADVSGSNDMARKAALRYDLNLQAGRLLDNHAEYSRVISELRKAAPDIKSRHSDYLSAISGFQDSMRAYEMGIHDTVPRIMFATTSGFAATCAVLGVMCQFSN